MISRRLRFEVLRRDGHRYRYCGATPEQRELQVDHVIPTALGGEDKPENLVCACRRCNAGKSSIAPDAPIVQGVADDALRWAEALKRAAAIQSAKRDEIATVVAAVDNEWCQYENSAGDGPPTRPPDWKQSLERLIVAGATQDELLEYVEITMTSPARDCWRYFCGVAWKRVAERQELARDLLSAESDD